MRTLLCAFLLLGAMALQAAGIIIATPAVPAKDTLVTFTLTGVTAPLVNWDFGDGQAQAGGVVVTHAYHATGLFPVRATYVPIGAQLPTTTFLQLRVTNLTGPAAPFPISSLRLRWEDGRTDQSVDRDFLPLIAYADLKFEGTGLFQAQWTLDGIPIGIFTEQLAFANTVVFDTRRLPQADIDKKYPAPLFHHERGKAICVMGNYAPELFRVMKEGPLTGGPS